MKTSTHFLIGVLLVIAGVAGLYNIRQFPMTALFASLGLIAGIFLIGKATNKF